MKTNLIGLFLLILSACAQTPEKNEAEASQKTEIRKKGWSLLDAANYSIQYPSDWEENKTGQMGTSFVLFSPVDSEGDDFRENVNLVEQDLSGRNFDLDSYSEFSEKQIRDMLGISDFMENKRLKNANGDYQKFVYAGKQGNYILVFEQYCWVINEKAFVLTFTSEKDQYASYKYVGEKILDSFVMK